MSVTGRETAAASGAAAAAAGRLADQVAVVTGAASGIGRCTSLMLASEGARMILVDRIAEPLDRVVGEVKEAGGDASACACDLLEPERLKLALDAVAASYGRLDILVNSAGVIGPRAAINDLTVADWDLLMDVNARGTFVAIQAVVPWMIRGGSGGKIVNVSSLSARRTRAFNVAYPASKAAVEGLTRAVAGELAQYEINVNAVAPGIVNTAIHGAGDSEEARRERARNGPGANLFGRVSEVEDIAGTILFLCLPESRQITAQVLHVSAGAIVS